MAKRKDDQLFDMLRARGLRKSAARALSEAATTGRNAGGQAQKHARSLITDLRGVADDVEDRLKGGPAKRKLAAQKAAKTRAASARKRSAAAKKGARTRAKAGSR